MTTLLLAAMMALDETPEKTIQGFIAAFNSRDSAGMSRRVVGQKPGSLPPSLDLPSVKTSVGGSKIAGDEATVEADTEMSSPGGRAQKSHETVHLRRVGSDWQIVPVNPQSVGMGEQQIVGFLAYLITNPELFTQARRAAKKTACLSNVKQLALGTLLYIGDHDDFIPKTSAGWKAAVLPYVKNERIFHCPDDASGKDSYFLDPRVAGKSVVAIAYPAETAMIVEGSANKTAFRHAGSASLGFVDGHAKSVKAPFMLKARTISLK